VNSPPPIYLDYAAATPLADFVREAMESYLSDNFYNPSSPYFPAVKVRREYEAAKQRLGASFGVKADECIMTAGATESINLAFSGVKGHVVTSTIEHPAVLEVAKCHDHTLVEVNEKGRVDPQSVAKAITDKTELVSIALANNELGTIQPLRKIAANLEAIRKKRLEQGNTTPLLFHSDASQGFGQIDIHATRLGLDLLTLNAAKIYGPKQVGLLWAKQSVVLKPSIVGGGQERGLRSGTENVSGVIGFAIAAERAAAQQQSENVRLAALRDKLQQQLHDAFPEAVILGDQKHRLPGHLSMAFPGIDAERIIFKVESSVLLSTGSACSANKQTASHVLRAIGISDSYINGSLRISLGKPTTEEDVLEAASVLIEALTNEYKRMRVS
jgi:cysteine desulfurase